MRPKFSNKIMKFIQNVQNYTKNFQNYTKIFKIDNNFEAHAKSVKSGKTSFTTIKLLKLAQNKTKLKKNRPYFITKSK